MPTPQLRNSTAAPSPQDAALTASHRTVYASPKLSGTPYRAELANQINQAADMRRRGLKGLARNWLDIAHRAQHSARYWSPIP